MSCISRFVKPFAKDPLFGIFSTSPSFSSFLKACLMGVLLTLNSFASGASIIFSPIEYLPFRILSLIMSAISSVNEVSCENLSIVIIILRIKWCQPLACTSGDPVCQAVAEVKENGFLLPAPAHQNLLFADNILRNQKAPSSGIIRLTQFQLL